MNSIVAVYLLVCNQYLPDLTGSQEIVLKVLYQGKPAAQAQIYLGAWDLEPIYAEQGIGETVTINGKTVPHFLWRGLTVFGGEGKIETLGPWFSDEQGMVKIQLKRKWGVEMVSAMGKERGIFTGFIPRLHPRLNRDKERVVNLLPTQALEGQVVVKGKPVPGVKTRLRQTRDFPNDNEYSQVYYFSDKAAFPGAVTDEQGRFRLTHVPASLDNIAEFTKEGYARTCSNLSAEKPTVVSMDEPGRLKITLADVSEKNKFFKNPFLIKSKFSKQEEDWFGFQKNIGKNFKLYYNFFKDNEIKNIAPGEYTLTWWQDGTNPFAMDPVDFTIERGKLTELILKPYAAGSVQGKLVDTTTSKGIPNIPMALRSLDDPFINSWYGITDKNGGFQIFCNSKGDIKVELLQGISFGDELREPPGQKFILKSGKPMELPEIKISLPAFVIGSVKDDKGNAVPGPFEFFMEKSDEMGRVDPNLWRTHECNKFEMGLDIIFKGDYFHLLGPKPDEFTIPYVRKGKAVNIPKVMNYKELNSLPNFVVSEKNGVVVKGKVTDAKGKPIEEFDVKYLGINAELSREIELKRLELKAGSGEGISISDALKKVKTDSEGNFVIENLWPNTDYKIFLDGKELSPLDGKLVQRQFFGKPGQTIDLGPMPIREEIKKFLPGKKG